MIRPRGGRRAAPAGLSAIYSRAPQIGLVSATELRRPALLPDTMLLIGWTWWQQIYRTLVFGDGSHRVSELCDHLKAVDFLPVLTVPGLRSFDSVSDANVYVDLRLISATR
jgi:hypothetical protein